MLFGSSATSNSLFGMSMSLHNNHLIVGSRGLVYVFEYDDTIESDISWIEKYKIERNDCTLCEFGYVTSIQGIVMTSYILMTK